MPWTWQIIEGIVTVVVGAISFFGECCSCSGRPRGLPADPVFTVLVDFPHTATFLTPEERAWVVHRKSTSASSMVGILAQRR